MIRRINAYYYLVFLLLLLPFPVYAAPTLVLQGAEMGQYKSVAVSNDGKWIVASDYGYSNDNVKIFNAIDGLQWGEFPDESGKMPLCFTPDGKRVLTTQANSTYNMFHGDQKVLLCAIPSGQILHTFDVDPFAVWCDNTRLRGLRDGQLVEFDLNSGKQTATCTVQDAPLTSEHNNPLYAFSENGAFLVEGSAGIIRFWDARNGHLLGEISDKLRAIGRTAISNDGKKIASEGDDPNWTPPDYSATQAAFARQLRLHVWNAQTHKLLHTFPGYAALHGGASLLQFSSDGKVLFGFGSGSKGLDRFNLKTEQNKMLPPPQKDFHKQMDEPAAVSPNGLWLAGAGQIYQSDLFNPGLQLWSIEDSKLKTKFAGALRGVDKVKWSPDGKYLAGGSRFALWDAHTGKLLAENPHAYMQNFSWVDASTIRSTGGNKLQLWSIPAAKVNSEFSLPKVNFGYSQGISSSPDGHTVLSGNPNADFSGGEIWVWDVANNKVRQKIKPVKSLWGALLRISDILWLPDNRHIVFSTPNLALILLDTQTGNVEKSISSSSMKAMLQSSPILFKLLRVSSDGKWLAVRTSYDDKIIIFDLKNLSLNPAEGLLWWEKTVSKYKQLYGAGGLTNKLKSEISPDGRLMAYNDDYQRYVSIRNVKENREVLRLYLLNGTTDTTTLDWIAITPDGYYDASPAGEKRLRWKEGNKFWPIEKSRARFHRPDIIKHILQGD